MGAYQKLYLTYIAANPGRTATQIQQAFPPRKLGDVARTLSRLLRRELVNKTAARRYYLVGEFARKYSDDECAGES